MSESEERVNRLIAWVQQNRRDLLDEQGRPSSSRLAKATGRSVSYWSDVLHLERSGKGFGPAAARAAEQALGMPHLYLEAGGAPWPFDGITPDEWAALTERQRGRLEQAMLDVLAQMRSARTV